MADDLDPNPTLEPAPAPDPNPEPSHDPAPEPKGDPEPDWRAQFAGEDKAMLGFLGRYQSPKAFAEAAKKDREAIRNGSAYKLPENPTDEELATYRKENGIPESSDGYLADLPDGLSIGEDDRGELGLDPFLSAFHDLNIDKAKSDKLISIYMDQASKLEASAIEAQNEADGQAKDANIEALRDEWGGDYKRNNQVLRNFVSQLPEAVRDAFDKGRGPDGVPLGYNTEVVKWLVGQALEANPHATVVPGAGAQASAAIADEIATLKTMMGNAHSEYWKGPKAEANQARYRELVAAQAKMK